VIHLCRVAGNTVWSHMASGPVAVRWEPINSYTLLYLFLNPKHICGWLILETVCGET